MGAIVWVILVVVGVISSIVSNARKQAAGAQPQQAPRRPPLQMPPRPLQQRPLPAPQPAVSVTPPPAPPRNRARPAQPAPAEVPAFLEHRPQAHRGRRLFGDRSSIVRGVIAAEILGKPLALRDGP